MARAAMTAAPIAMPCTVRAAINQPMPGASTQATEANT